MKWLAREASGLRHLRWGREIVATLEAHASHNPHLDEAERTAIAVATGELDRLVAAMSAAVKPYRDFLERERVKGRGRRRVGVLLCCDALGDVTASERRLASALLSSTDTLATRTTARAKVEDGPKAPKIALAGAALGAFVADALAFDEPRRHALGRVLAASLDAFRDGLAAIDANLRAAVPIGVVDSIYPELADDLVHVADDPDPNDDASAPPG
jgi:hypothetical protein